MKKLIISSVYDFLLFGLLNCVPYRSLTTFFYKKNSVDYLKKKNIEIVSLLDYIDDENLRIEITNYSLFEKHCLDSENNINIDFLLSKFNECIRLLINDINTTDLYDNSVIYAVGPSSFDLFADKVFDSVKKKNIKIIAWHDDMHAYSRIHYLQRTDIIKENYSLSLPIEELIFNKNAFNNSSAILTHSKPYLDYLNLNIYNSKTIQYYAPPDDLIFSMFTPSNFYQRKKKILASGNVRGYPLREFISYKIKSNNIDAISIYDYLPSSIASKNINDIKNNNFYAYYLKLSQYRGSFVGLHSKPIDFVVYKVFESLCVGTLLFCEYNENLDKLGLIKFEHYVPMYSNNLLDKEYIDKYLDTDEGLKIATNGYNFAKNFFNTKKHLDFFVDTINRL